MAARHDKAEDPRAARDLPGFCAPFARAVALGNGESIGDGRFASDAIDRRGVLGAPDADEILLGAAAGLVEELSLGQRGSIDLLALGLADHAQRDAVAAAVLRARVLDLEENVHTRFRAIRFTARCTIVSKENIPSSQRPR